MTRNDTSSKKLDVNMVGLHDGCESKESCCVCKHYGIGGHVVEREPESVLREIGAAYASVLNCVSIERCDFARELGDQQLREWERLLIDGPEAEE